MNLEEVRKLVTKHVNFPKEPIVFRDIHPILNSPAAREAVTNFLVERYKGKVDVVTGLETRGYYFGMLVADRLQLPFVPIRKEGKLPGEVFTHKYSKEYGHDTVQLQKGSIKEGQRVLVLDDLLATGGTALAAVELLQMAKVNIVEVHCLIELVELNGKAKLEEKKIPFHSLYQIHDKDD